MIDPVVVARNNIFILVMDAVDVNDPLGLAVCLSRKTSEQIGEAAPRLRWPIRYYKFQTFEAPIKFIPETFIKGGPGSGNFGHAGRPGRRGGSAPGGGTRFLSDGVLPRFSGHPLKPGGTWTFPDGSKYAAAKYRLSQQRVSAMLEQNKAMLVEQGLDPAAVTKTLRQIAIEGDMTVRVSPSTLDKILDSGRFKTQFETGTSKGLNDPAVRMEAEELGQGIPKDADVLDRPIYGYLTLGDRAGLETQYGDIEVVLNDELKTRSSMTAYDSLSSTMKGYVVSSPMMNPTVASIPAQTKFAKLASEGKISEIMESADYFEVQIQGGVSVKDISYVVDRGGKLKAAQVKKLKEIGIEVYTEPMAHEWTKGGPGSGNFGHVGRPGRRGGSAPGGGHRRLVESHGFRFRDEDNALNQSTLSFLPSENNLAAIRDGRERIFKHYGYDLDNVRETLRRLGEDGEPSVRMSHRILDLIVNGDGRLKTQFETGRSRGLLDTKARAEAEERGLGYPQDVDVTKRPIYGYLKYSDQVNSEEQYGDVDLRLRSDVKSRSTMTVGDSLEYFHEQKAAGTPVNKPDIEGIANSGPVMTYLDDGMTGPLSKIARRAGYVELQIQGGVSLDDVVEVIDYKNQLSSNTRSLLEARGIQVTNVWTLPAKGGPGSGNFGHAGRPGRRGGSVPGGGHRVLVESHGFRFRDEDNQPKVSLKFRAATDKIDSLVSRNEDFLQRRYSLSRDTVRAKMREFVSESTATIRCEPETLDKILSSGRFKTQFETRTSRGILDTRVRAGAEEAGLGVPRDVDPTQRPIYGYLKHKSGAEGTEKHYGSVHVELKEEVKSRSTMTVGDSLGQFQSHDVAGTPTLDPDLEGFNPDGGVFQDYVRGTRDVQRMLNFEGYIELQIQDGVKIGDISRIMYTDSTKYDPTWASHLSRTYGVEIVDPWGATVKNVFIKGGPGSGNFGHAGRPGHRGGSASRGSLQYRPPQSRIDAIRMQNEIKLAELGEKAIVNARSILSDYAENGKIMISVTHSSLAGILNDGRFRVGEETGTGLSVDQGYLERRQAENFGLGIPEESTVRPVYGILTKKGEQSGSELEYGKIQVYLHDYVKDRATMTLGDSFISMYNQNTVGTPVRKPDLEGVVPSSTSLSYIAGSSSSTDFRQNNYIEVQIQGGVRVSEIARVVNVDRGRPSQGIPKKNLPDDLVSHLESLGIEVVQ